MHTQIAHGDPDGKRQRSEFTASSKKKKAGSIMLPAQSFVFRPWFFASLARSAKVQGRRSKVDSDLRFVQHRLHVLLFLRSTETLNLNRRRLLEHVLRVELGHFLVVPFLFRRPMLAGGACLVASVFRDPEFVEVGLRSSSNRFLIEDQRVLLRIEVN